MKFIASLTKMLIENIRDWKLLVFVMLFAPCFTDFDLYVPGLVVLALLNVIFAAGKTLIKEVEKAPCKGCYFHGLKAGSSSRPSV